MRPPSPLLVVDAAILIAAARGRSSGAVIDAGRSVRLLTTERVIEETRRRIMLGLKRPDLLPIVDALTAEMTVVASEELEAALPAAARALRDAVASRNGATRDDHVLALAWLADADVWTTDRDFAGTGVASWSTPNLMRALVEDE